MKRGFWRICLGLLVICVGPSVLAQGHVIGNGGDGFLLGEHVYLRDLYESGTHLQPYIGETADPRLLRQLDFLPLAARDFPYSKELLARKLTDLNRAYPLLGDFVLGAMKMYTYQRLETPLAPVPDPEGILPPPGPGGAFRQIANRHDFIIGIHGPSWDLMNDANRVALLVHESVYSLLKPFCPEKNVCMQKAQYARAITGYFFHESFRIRGTAIVQQAVIDLIDVPKDLPASLMPSRDLEWTVWTHAPANGPGKTLTIVTPLPQRDDMLDALIAGVCQNMDQWVKDGVQQGRSPDQYSVVSSIELMPIRRGFETYPVLVPSTDGSPPLRSFQLRVKISPRTTPLIDTVEHAWSDASLNCTDVLFRHRLMVSDSF